MRLEDTASAAVLQQTGGGANLDGRSKGEATTADPVADVAGFPRSIPGESLPEENTAVATPATFPDAKELEGATRKRELAAAAVEGPPSWALENQELAVGSVKSAKMEGVCSAAFLYVLAKADGLSDSAATTTCPSSEKSPRGDVAADDDEAHHHRAPLLRLVPEGATSSDTAVLTSDVGAIGKSPDPSVLLPIHGDERPPWEGADIPSQLAILPASEAVLEAIPTDDQAARRESPPSLPSQLEEYEQAGDGDALPLEKGLSTVDPVPETEDAVSIDSKAMKAGVVHPSAEGQRPKMAAAESDRQQLPVNALPFCKTPLLWKTFAESDMDSACSSGPPPAQQLSKAVTEAGCDGCGLLQGKPVNPHSFGRGGRGADSVLFVPEDQSSTAVTMADPDPAIASSASSSSSEAAAMEVAGGWEECQVLRLPWYQDGPAAAAADGADRVSLDVYPAASGESTPEVSSTTTDRLHGLALVHEPPPAVKAASAALATRERPPSCPANLPMAEALAGTAGAEQQTACRWPPAEEVLLGVEPQRGDEGVPPAETALLLLAAPETVTSTDKLELAMTTKSAASFLSGGGAGESTFEIVLHDGDSLKQLSVTPETGGGDHSQAAVEASTAGASRAPVGRPDRAAAVEPVEPLGVVGEASTIALVHDGNGEGEAITLAPKALPEDGLTALPYQLQRHDVCPLRSPEERADETEGGEAVAGEGGGRGDKPEEDPGNRGEEAGGKAEGNGGELGLLGRDGDEMPFSAAAPSPVAESSAETAVLMNTPPVPPPPPPRGTGSACKEEGDDDGSGGGVNPQHHQAAGDSEEDGKDDEGKAVTKGTAAAAAEKKIGRERNDDHEDSSADCLEARVKEFNAWLASVEFPVRKVEAGVVGNGMRLGVVATEAIARERPYLSVPGSIVMDASKVRRGGGGLAAVVVWRGSVLCR